jgi:hypothetical protein
LAETTFGRSKWNRLSEKRKAQEAFSVLSDPEQVREGLEASNFVDFLRVLAYTVGGEKKQLDLLQKQLDVDLSLISSKIYIASQLTSIFDWCNSLGKPTDNLKDACSKELCACVSHADQSFRDHANVEVWVKPMQQLLSYHTYAIGVGWDKEAERVTLLAKQLVYRQLEIIFENHASSNMDKWTPALSDSENALVGWSTLSPVDWNTIFESILLLSFDRQFCELFGREKIMLERLSHKMKNAVNDVVYNWENLKCLRCETDLGTTNVCGSCRLSYNYPDVKPGDSCPACTDRNTRLDSKSRCNNYCSFTFTKHPAATGVGGALKTTYTGGHFEPNNPDAYKKAVHIPVPQSLSAPKHFGHLLWTYCRFVESLAAEK